MIENITHHFFYPPNQSDTHMDKDIQNSLNLHLYQMCMAFSYPQNLTAKIKSAFQCTLWATKEIDS